MTTEKLYARTRGAREYEELRDHDEIKSQLLFALSEEQADRSKAENKK